MIKQPLGIAPGSGKITRTSPAEAMKFVPPGGRQARPLQNDPHPFPEVAAASIPRKDMLIGTAVVADRQHRVGAFDRHLSEDVASLTFPPLGAKQQRAADAVLPP